MLTMNDLDPLIRQRSAVMTAQGEKVGSIGQVYLADVTDEPAWVTVHTGLFGTRESFVPLKGASVQDGRLVVGYPRDLVKHAPTVDPEGHLDPHEQTALYRHYGLVTPAPPGTVDTVPPASSDTGDTGDVVDADDTRVRREHTATPMPPSSAAAPVPGQEEGDGGRWMTRSEERLRVGTERYESGRVRLRKYVVTEEATVTVPLQREELRLEAEPITSMAPSGPDGSTPFQEESVEVVLREELAVVGKETVAVERVRLDTRTVTGRTTVREEVRKERIVVEGDGIRGETGIQAPRTSRGKASRKVGRRSSAAVDEPSSRIVRNRPNALLKGKNKKR